MVAYLPCSKKTDEEISSKLSGQHLGNDINIGHEGTLKYWQKSKWWEWNDILNNKYLFGANIYMNIFKCALQVHPSHPRGGHPPHSNLVRGKLPQPCRRRGLRFYVLSKTKQCEWSVLLKDTTSCPSQDLNPGHQTQSPAHWLLDYSRLACFAQQNQIVVLIIKI